MLAVIRPIENAPECSNAACHVHPAGQRVLGVIDANLSLAAVDAQIGAAPARNLTWFLVGAIAVRLSGRRMVFMWVVVLPAGQGADRRARTAWRTATWSTACRCAPTTNWATWRPRSTR